MRPDRCSGCLAFGGRSAIDCSIDVDGLIGRPQALLGSAIVPVALCAVLGTFRGSLANTSAALILVLVVVAAASTGYRSAGLLAAVAAGVALDFFLTAPYLTLAITDPADLETAAMLLVVGVAVTMVVQWGHRWQRQVRDRDAYLRRFCRLRSEVHTRPDRQRE